MSANIKTWQERMEGGSYLGVGCYVSGTDTVKTGYTGARAQIAARDAEIADLRAALAAKAVHDGWQPIETAPKDGARILLLTVDGIIEGFWVERNFLYSIGWNQNIVSGDWGANVEISSQPTHWMPLPATPSPAEPSHE